MIFLIISLFAFPVKAMKEEAQLNHCIDGDTASFIINDKKETVRFLAINTPEYSKQKKQPLGKEASDFTCNELKTKTIEVERDPKSNKYDKYNRLLLWVYVDSELLQDKLVKNGYAEIKYIYGDYLYLNELKESEKIAKSKGIGIWNPKICKIPKEQKMIQSKKKESGIISLLSMIIKLFEEIIKLMNSLVNSIS